jgi:hypothetical protein
MKSVAVLPTRMVRRYQTVNGEAYRLRKGVFVVRMPNASPSSLDQRQSIFDAFDRLDHKGTIAVRGLAEKVEASRDGDRLVNRDVLVSTRA